MFQSVKPNYYTIKTQSQGEKPTPNIAPTLAMKPNELTKSTKSSNSHGKIIFFYPITLKDSVIQVNRN